MAEKITTNFSECSGVAQIKWVIEDFLNLPFKHNETLFSPEFRLSDSCWKIELYPKGCGVEYSEHICMFLCRVKGPGTYRVSCSIEIVSGALKQKRHMEKSFPDPQKSSYGWGWCGFSKISAISDSLQKLDDAVTIFCCAVLLEGSDESVEFQTSKSRLEATTNLSKNFGKLLADGHHADVKLQVRGKEFTAHKAVLSSRSEVFFAMFQHEMTENHTGIVTIDDINPDYFQDFLRYVYTADFNIVSPENALDLYKAGDKYDLKDLKKECTLIMKENVSLETIFDFHLCAKTYDETSLLSATTEFFIKNGETICQTDEWEDFFLQNPKTAKELMLVVFQRNKKS